MHRSSLSLPDGMYLRRIAVLIFAASVALCASPAFAQFPDNRPAQKSASASYESPHLSLRAAHLDSFSLNILALWRISTGNER